MAYLKPQTPIQLNDNYIYPLTTADQVILNNGNRLNSLFKKTIKENATLQVANWSDTKPYTQTITISESTDDYNVDANVAYSDGDNAALHAAAGCISYIKKNHKEITFYCLKSKPEIDIPIEITGTCRNTIATVEEGIKLNFDIVGGTTQPTNPKENTIWVNTDVPITGYKFSATEPEGMNEGEVWIKTGDDSGVAFDIVDGATICPLSVKQYIDGVLIDKTAMSYQNAEWVEWIPIGALYWEGNECTDVTGGWIAKALDWDNSSGADPGVPTLTKNDTNMVATQASGKCGLVVTANKINVSGYKKLYFRGKLYNDSGSANAKYFARLALYSAFGSYVFDNRVAYMDNNLSADTQTYELNISEISANVYIAFQLYEATSHLEVEQIWME